MKTFYGFRDFFKSNARYRNFVLTMGVFDGVHLGHQEIIKALKAKARKKKLGTILVTFDPHPANVSGFKKTPLVISLSHRLGLLSEIGLDYAIVLRFDKRLARTTAASFLKEIAANINISEIVIGENFFFGKDKRGGLRDLRKFSYIYIYKISVIKPFKRFGRVVSSTWIRRLIMKGDLKKASALLSRPVTVLGRVTEGKSRGRIMGFPTANVNPHHEAIPPAGVYAVKVKFENKIYKGVLNIGIRPTFIKKRFPEPEPTIEVHIFDFQRSIYGAELEIMFIAKIREEKRFENMSSLRRQILKDTKRARRILG